jgi:hypothetical protein
VVDGVTDKYTAEKPEDNTTNTNTNTNTESKTDTNNTNTGNVNATTENETKSENGKDSEKASAEQQMCILEQTPGIYERGRGREGCKKKKREGEDQENGETY